MNLTQLDRLLESLKQVETDVRALFEIATPEMVTRLENVTEISDVLAEQLSQEPTSEHFERARDFLEKVSVRILEVLENEHTEPRSRD